MEPGKEVLEEAEDPDVPVARDEDTSSTPDEDSIRSLPPLPALDIFMNLPCGGAWLLERLVRAFLTEEMNPDPFAAGLPMLVAESTLAAESSLKYNGDV